MDVIVLDTNIEKRIDIYDDIFNCSSPIGLLYSDKFVSSSKLYVAGVMTHLEYSYSENDGVIVIAYNKDLVYRICEEYYNDIDNITIVTTKYEENKEDLDALANEYSIPIKIVSGSRNGELLNVMLSTINKTNDENTNENAISNKKEFVNNTAFYQYLGKKVVKTVHICINDVGIVVDMPAKPNSAIIMDAENDKLVTFKRVNINDVPSEYSKDNIDSLCSIWCEIKKDAADVKPFDIRVEDNRDKITLAIRSFIGSIDVTLK